MSWGPRTECSRSCDGGWQAVGYDSSLSPIGLIFAFPFRVFLIDRKARLRRVRQFAENGGATCDMQTLRLRLSLLGHTAVVHVAHIAQHIQVPEGEQQQCNIEPCGSLGPGWGSASAVAVTRCQFSANQQGQSCVLSEWGVRASGVRCD